MRAEDDAREVNGHRKAWSGATGGEASCDYVCQGAEDPDPHFRGVRVAQLRCDHDGACNGIVRLLQGEPEVGKKVTIRRWRPGDDWPILAVWVLV